MKTATTLIIALFICSGLFAQPPTEKERQKHLEKVQQSREKGTVMVDMDTLYKSGKPYAILEEVKSVENPLGKDYSLKSLSGNELAYLKYECTRGATEVCYHAFIFPESGKRAEIEDVFNFKPEKIIVDNNLILNDSLNPAGVNKLLLVYPPKFSTQPQQTVASSNQYETVERDRNRMIQVFGTEIKQDFKLIGTCQRSTSLGNGKVYTVYTFYLPNGTKAAEATQVEMRSETYRIITFKDHRTHTKTVSTTGLENKDLAKFLVDLYYL